MLDVNESDTRIVMGGCNSPIVSIGPDHDDEFCGGCVDGTKLGQGLVWSVVMRYPVGRALF